MQAIDEIIYKLQIELEDSVVKYYPLGHDHDYLSPYSSNDRFDDQLDLVGVMNDYDENFKECDADIIKSNIMDELKKGVITHLHNASDEVYLEMIDCTDFSCKIESIYDMMIKNKYDLLFLSLDYFYKFFEYSRENKKYRKFLKKRHIRFVDFEKSDCIFIGTQDSLHTYYNIIFTGISILSYALPSGDRNMHIELRHKTISTNKFKKIIFDPIKPCRFCLDLILSKPDLYYDREVMQVEVNDGMSVLL